MDLKNFLPGQKKTEEYFWSLLIEPGWVQAAVWRINDNKVQVISMSSSSAWELDEELTSSIDACLSSAVQDFPEEVSVPTKTVFGVSSSWVSEGQIKEDYLAKIKRICSDLSLTPVGFVVLPEATAHYFKAEEGAPLNAIILGISKESLEISLFRLGSLVGISQVARSVSIVDDVSEGLARFVSNEAFPSRIILYDGREGELEEIRQNLIKANWEDYGKIKFLHTPKIELLDPERKVYAVSLAGGAELADVKEIITPPKEEFPEPPKLVTAEESLENVTAPDENLTPSDFGFSIDEDVAQEKSAGEPIEQGISEDFAQPDVEQAPPQMAEERTIRKEQKTRRRLMPSFGFMNNIKSAISALFSRIKNLKKLKTNVSFVTKPLVAGIIFFILIIAAGFSFWWFFPKGT